MTSPPVSPGWFESELEATDRTRSRPSLLYRISRHRAGLVGGIVVLAFMVIAAFGPLLAPFDPLEADVAVRARPPSGDHWLGTDELGRDILSRLLHGARLSIGAGFLVVFVGTVVGIPLGAISGYVGGRLDLVIQRVVDLIQTFPGIVLLVLIAALAGPSLQLAIVGLGFLSAPDYARLMRGNVLQVKTLVYVDASRATGCKQLRTLVRHVLPNSISPVVVQTSIQAASAMTLLAGIGFLGLGAQPPTPEWGAMLAQGQPYLRTAPHVVLFPGIAVSLVVLGLNLLGDALNDALDPRSVYGRKWSTRVPIS